MGQGHLRAPAAQDPRLRGIWLDGEAGAGRGADPGLQLPAAQIQDNRGHPAPQRHRTSTPTISTSWPLPNTAKLVGFNVLVGGGLGHDPRRHHHLPRQASDFGFIPSPRAGGGGRRGHHPARLGQPGQPQERQDQSTPGRVGSAAFKGRGGEPRRHPVPGRFTYEFTSRGDRFRLGGGSTASTT